MPDLKRRAIGAAWWSTLEITARYGMQFVVMIVLARLLSPSDFGLVAMLAVFTGIGALLVESGFGTALIQQQQIDVDDETTVFLFTTVTSIVAVLLLWFSAPAISAFYAHAELVPLIRFMSLVLPFGALAAVPDAILTIRLNFRARANAEVISSMSAGAAAIVLAYLGYGVWSLAWLSILSIALRTILLWVFSQWRPVGRYSSSSFRRLFGFGFYMTLSALLETLSTRLQSVLLGKLFNSGMAGYYTLAQNTQQAPTAFIGGVLHRVGLPVFSAVAPQPLRLLAALRLSLRLSMFIFVPCMFGLALAAKPLVLLLYGRRWLEAAPILSVLAFGGALWPINVLNLAALSSQGRSDLFFRLAVIKKVVVIALIVVCSAAGPLAIAGGVLVGNLLSTFVNTWYSKRLLGYGALAQLTDQFATLALSIASATAGWATLHWTRPGLASTISAIALAAVVYLGGAALFRHPALGGIADMGRALIAGKRRGNESANVS